MFNIQILKKVAKKIYLDVELNPSFSFDECSCDLQNHRFNIIGAAPTLFRQQFHAQCAAAQYEPVADRWAHYSNKWRLERKIILQISFKFSSIKIFHQLIKTYLINEMQKNVVLILLLFQGYHILVKSAVRINSGKSNKSSIKISFKTQNFFYTCLSKY